MSDHICLECGNPFYLPRCREVKMTGYCGLACRMAATVKKRARPLTHERLTQALDYDPEAGIFLWAENGHGRRKIGDVAGNLDKTEDKLDRWIVGIEGRQYFAHRLAWFYVYGEWPKGLIDHRDRNALNNRIGNLREATNAQNRANSRTNKDNVSGLKGVSLSPYRTSETKRPYWASITINGKPKHLGSFETAEKAHEAYLLAAKAAVGEFANGG